MKVNPAQRRKARHYALQALYQWYITQKQPSVIEVEFCHDHDMQHVDRAHFHALLTNIPALAEALDTSYEAFLQGRSREELDPITLILLRMASYEMQHCIEVPFKVVISEAVSLGKKFGASDSFKFINAVLDKLAIKLRNLETAHAEKIVHK